MSRGIALLLLLWAVPATAQEVVRGTVIDGGTGGPVVGAQVSAIPASGNAWSVSDGSFHLSVERRPDSVRVIAIGYAERRVALGSGDARIALTALPVILPEVVTTGGRWEERLALVTAPVTSIPKAEIEAQAATSVDQIVSQVPGVQTIPVQPAGTALAIRGIGESRVLVLLDGEPVGGSLLELPDLSRLSTVAVERIEVTKGPVSSEYGSDALGGVVNVITQPPPGAPLFSAAARVGSFGRLEGNLGAAGTTGRLGFRLTGAMRQQDAVPGQVQSEAPFERVYDVRGSARYALNATSTLRADANYLYERQRWPVGGGFNGFNDNKGINGLVEATTVAFGSSWRARVFAESFESLYRSAQGDAPYANTGTSQDESMVRALLAQQRQAGAHTIDAGLQASFRRISAPDRLVGGDMSDDQLEAFAKDAVRLGRVLGTAGARYTWNSRWGNNLSPSIGVAWEPTDAVRIRGSIARGFRAPSFKELGWSFGNPAAGYIVTGNPDLVPESSWSQDVALSWALTPDLVADIDAYQNDVKNLIDFSTIGITPEGYLRFQPVNIGQARTRGIESGLRWTPGPWSFSAAYSYLDAKNLSDGLPLNRRAAHSGRFRGTRSFGVLKGLRADATAIYTGSAPLVGDVGNDELGIVGQQGAFLQWNFGVELGINELLELNAGVDNAFDQRPEGWTGLIERRFRIGLKTEWSPGRAVPRATAQREEARDD